MTKLRQIGIITGKTINTPFGFDEENEDCMKFKDLIHNYFSANRGIYYSLCDAGLGIYCAEEVLKSNNSLFCVTPYENQAAKWSDNFRERYFSIHEKSLDQKLISTRLNENSLTDAEYYITDNCDEILVIISDNEEIPNSVLKALSDGKKVTLIDCQNLSIKLLLKQ